ncbi:hypothetical protein ES702_00687 [subsurface metagenome]
MFLRRFYWWLMIGETTVSTEHINSWGLPELVNFAYVGGYKYLTHSFNTHSRYHKIGRIENIIKRFNNRIIDRNLIVWFSKCIES